MTEIALLRKGDGSDVVVLPHVEVGDKTVTNAIPTSTFSESIAVVGVVHDTMMAAIAALQGTTGADEKEPFFQTADEEDGADDFDAEKTTDSEPVEKVRRLE